MNARQRGEYYRKVERLRRQLDTKYYDKFKNSITKQFNNFANRIKRDGLGAAKSSLGLDLWEKELIKIFESLYKEAAVLFGNSVYRAIKIDANRKGMTFGFNREWTQQMMDFLMAQGFGLVTDITSTTKKKLLAIVQKGIEDGLSVDDIVALIRSDEQTAYIAFRAARIVRTEVMRSSNMASMMAADSHDFYVDKQWISARDNRTRRIPRDQFDHVELDGVIKEYDEPFTETGKEGQYISVSQPGALNQTDDSETPAGFTINCRCTVAFIPKRDKNGNLLLKPKLHEARIY